MDTISYTAARQQLAKTMDRVIEGHETVIITRQKAGAVVMMSLEDFNSMRATMYLLGNPANAEHLRKSLADVEAGRTKRVRLTDLETL